MRGYFVATAGIVTIATILGVGASAAETRDGILRSKFKIPTVVTVKGHQETNIGPDTEIAAGFKVTVGEKYDWVAKPKAESYLALLPRDQRFSSCAGKSAANSYGEILVEWSDKGCTKKN